MSLLLGSILDAQWPWAKKGTLIWLVEFKGEPKNQKNMKKGSKPLGNKAMLSSSTRRAGAPTAPVAPPCPRRSSGRKAIGPNCPRFDPGSKREAVLGGARQTNTLSKQSNKQTNKQTDRQTDKQTNNNNTWAEGSTQVGESTNKYNRQLHHLMGNP